MKYVVRGRLHLGIGVVVDAGSRDGAFRTAKERLGEICSFHDVFTEKEYEAYRKAKKEVMKW